MTGDPVRVLIVDDNKAFAEAEAETLARAGYECTLATSGPAGAKKIADEDFDGIPGLSREIREKLGLRPGQKITLLERDGILVPFPINPWKSSGGS